MALDFRERFSLVRDTIIALAPVTDGRTRVCEVDGGPGYLSLELARAGFAVTGLDLSPHSICRNRERDSR